MLKKWLNNTVLIKHFSQEQGVDKYQIIIKIRMVVISIIIASIKNRENKSTSDEKRRNFPTLCCTGLPG